MTLRGFRDEALGISVTIEERFLDVGFAADQELPSAHLLASEPADGWIAALAIVTVRAEPLPADEWLELHLARARASFGSWAPEAHEMLVAPEAGTLAGRPAIHVRYRLSGGGAEDEPSQEEAGPVPESLVEHWTVLVAERRWLLTMELMVQPAERWDVEQEALALPFRTLELLSACLISPAGLADTARRPLVGPRSSAPQLASTAKNTHQASSDFAVRLRMMYAFSPNR